MMPRCAGLSTQDADRREGSPGREVPENFSPPEQPLNVPVRVFLHVDKRLPLSRKWAMEQEFALAGDRCPFRVLRGTRFCFCFDCILCGERSNVVDKCISSHVGEFVI
jgi:hypothetical protein